jgi:hypothetical protein
MAICSPHQALDFVRLFLNLLHSRAEAGQGRGNQITDEENFPKSLSFEHNVVRRFDERRVDRAGFHRSDMVRAAAKGNDFYILLWHKFVAPRQRARRHRCSRRKTRCRAICLSALPLRKCLDARSTVLSRRFRQKNQKRRREECARKDRERRVVTSRSIVEKSEEGRAAGGEKMRKE